MDNLRKVDSEEFLLNLFRNLARQDSVPVYIRIGNNESFFTQLSFKNKKGTEFYIKDLINKLDSSGTEDISISFFKKDLFFNFSVRLSDYNFDDEENNYIIQRPKFVYSSYKRLVSRFELGADDIGTINCQKGKNIFKVLDISTKGMSFISDELKLDIGKVISGSVLQFDSGEEVEADFVVKHSFKEDESNVYGVNFLELNWSSYNTIFSYIFNKQYSSIKHLFDFPVGDVYELYAKSGYINLKEDDSIEKNFESMAKINGQIKQNNQVSSNLVYCQDSKLITACSILRIYSNTFLVHQLASSAEARMNFTPKMSIYQGILDHMLNNPYFKYQISYFNANETWHVKLFKEIGQYIPDPNDFLHDETPMFECVSSDLEELDDSIEINVELVTSYNEFIRFCESSLSQLECNCYCYNENIHLTDIKQLYTLLGLTLERKIWKIEKDNKTIAYAVAEAYSKGLNLYNVLNMCRVHFINDFVNYDMNLVLRLMLSEVSLFFKHYGIDKFFMLTKISDLSILPTISIKGLNYSAMASKVIMSYKGISEYKKILTANFA